MFYIKLKKPLSLFFFLSYGQFDKDSSLKSTVFLYTDLS